MKVVIITAATNTIFRFRIDMARRFRDLGNEVFIFGDEPASKWEKIFQDEGMEYRQYFVSRNGINPFQDLKTKQSLECLLAEIHPDKIFTYQAKPNIYGALAAGSVGIDDVYIMMGGLGSVFRSEDLKSKVLGRVVGFEYKQAFKKAKAVFFQNKDDVNLFCGRRYLSGEKTVLTRGSGVNLDQYSVEPLPEKTSFLFIGRLVRGKGIVEYLNACRALKKKYPHSSFGVLGAFDSNPTAICQDDLDPFIEDGSVSYFGEQPDVRPYIKDASVFVLPSYYGEGTPKSALEAMSMGRPLVVADAVGTREVVVNGENGFLVRPKDTEGLIATMELFLKNQELIRKMGLKSREFAEDVFDVNKVNQTICATMGLE